MVAGGDGDEPDAVLVAPVVVRVAGALDHTRVPRQRPAAGRCSRTPISMTEGGRVRLTPVGGGEDGAEGVGDVEGAPELHPEPVPARLHHRRRLEAPADLLSKSGTLILGLSSRLEFIAAY